MNSEDGGAKPSAAPVDPVFPRFFQEGEQAQGRIVGLIAYGLYQEALREWVDEFKAREGRYPRDEELRSYQRSWTASRLDGLRNAGVQALAGYADTIAREIEQQALRQALQGRFWRSVGAWVVGAVIYSVALFAVLVALSRAGVDPVGLLQSMIRPSGTQPVTADESRPAQLPDGPTR